MTKFTSSPSIMSTFVLLLLILSISVFASPTPPPGTFVDIHLKLDLKTFDQILKITDYIHSIDANDEIDFHHLSIPHVTLYLTEFQSQHFTTITNRIKNIVESYSGPRCVLNLTDPILSGSYGMWNVANNPCLQNLSNLLVENLKQYIVQDQPIPGWVQNLPEPERSQRIKLIKEYGSPNVYQFFQPHVTLAWDNTTTSLLKPIFSKPFPPPALHFPENSQFFWHIFETGMGHVGPHGTVLKNADYADFFFK